jgi:hypothetical protein
MYLLGILNNHFDYLHLNFHIICDTFSRDYFFFEKKKTIHGVFFFSSHILWFELNRSKTKECTYSLFFWIGFAYPEEIVLFGVRNTPKRIRKRILTF